MKIRQSNSETLTVKVYIHENKKEETFLVSIPDIFFSIQFDYHLFGEALTEHLYVHLFNILDEKEAAELALRITQWTSEV
ncbi:YueH family protein [Macrococcus equipercicus]|uniref:YueH family protein n=1 Tax=Macrococcus equipercicus TaxID=69967 RepID=A0A9Q9F2J7_9STAP|nr:YueH family protein [Macrococcus equipercicus]KAA1042609.1 hypothetical protein ERX35_001645 [Macrococcus equipercicus]UTH14471.1 YueH family protein [Macrococcus equipercicus]